MFSIRVIVLMIFLLMPFSAFGAAYYVSMSDGDDSRNSTQAQSSSTPWKTVAKINSFMGSLVAGDSVLFKRGDTWTLDGTGGEAAALEITCSGSAGEGYITFGAYGSGNLPIFNGNAANSWAGLVYINTIAGNKSYINIQYLDLYNANKEAFNGNPYYLGSGVGGNNVSYIVMENCIFRSNNTAGFSLVSLSNYGAVKGATNHIWFRNNVVHNSQWNGVKMCMGIEYVYIYSNTIYYCLHNGIDTDNYSGTLLSSYYYIYGNTLYSNDQGIYATGLTDSEIYENDIYSGAHYQETNGIKLDMQSEEGGVAKPLRVTIRNNRIWDMTYSGAYGLFVSQATDSNVWNNTVYGSYNTFYESGNTGLSNYNNLAYACTTETAALINYGSDPKFISVITPDFHLQSDSPVIDQGTNVGLSYSGAAPDLGAYEFSAYPTSTGITIKGGIIK